MWGKQKKTLVKVCVAHNWQVMCSCFICKHSIAHKKALHMHLFMLVIMHLVQTCYFIWWKKKKNIGV